MFRFTIRDLLWLAVVVGLSCGWWIERRQRLTEHRKEYERWRNLAELQLRAFQIEQSNMQAARVRAMEELHRRLQAINDGEKDKEFLQTYRRQFQ